MRFGPPRIAARLGMIGICVLAVAQACATAVWCLATAAAASRLSDGETHLVITADRKSNGPLLVYPRSAGLGWGASGRGVSLFTGCAAGAMGAAAVIEAVMRSPNRALLI
jgi:hypothetical protein